MSSVLYQEVIRTSLIDLLDNFMLTKYVHLVYNEWLLLNIYRISRLKINGTKFKQGDVIVEEMNYIPSLD